MMSIGNKVARAENDGVAVVGNNNTVINNNDIVVINRSFIFDVCCIITDADIPCTDEYSINSNVDWIKKYEYNKVSVYREIFDADSYAYDDIENILNEFPNRELLIRKLHTIYLQKEKIRKAKNEDGDFVLNLVYEEIYNIIEKCEKPNQNRLTLEERERSIFLLIFYAFTKCQILKKPLKNGEL